MASEGAYQKPQAPVVKTESKVDVQCNNCGFITKATEKDYNSDQLACYWCQSLSFNKLEKGKFTPRYESLDKAGLIPAYLKGVRRIGG